MLGYKIQASQVRFEHLWLILIVGKTLTSGLHSLLLRRQLLRSTTYLLIGAQTRTSGEYRCQALCTPAVISLIDRKFLEALLYPVLYTLNSVPSSAILRQAFRGVKNVWRQKRKERKIHSIVGRGFIKQLKDFWRLQASCTVSLLYNLALQVRFRAKLF